MAKRLEIKICGLTNLEDAKASLKLGADYLGFVIYPRSPRGISVDTLKDICRKLPAASKKVAVFVNAGIDEIENTYKACKLHAVQLHGDEKNTDYVGVKFRYWRAVRVGRTSIFPDPSLWDPDRYVVDAAVPGMYGGTGTTADWDTAASLAEKYAIMLAGGISSDNVRQAFSKVRPAGIDISSSVEICPGKKDLKKIEKLINIIRSIKA